MNQAKSAWGVAWGSAWASAWGAIASDCGHAPTRPIAVQGIGYKPLYMAVQGFLYTLAVAPSGTGHAARPYLAVRPAQTQTYRSAMQSHARPSSTITSRPSTRVTTRNKA